ncbi:MAG: hypothetical protein NTX24_02715 [Candidatus Pacearchaeota archaeon]|nr:hypothetical protein [Candidatus Pacearchaeota archaeon]
MVKIEKVILENYCITDIFKEDFIEKIKGLSGETFPISLVLINEKGSEDKKEVSPIIFSHQSNEEIKKKIMHLESPNTDLLNELLKVLKNKNEKQ